MLTYRTTTQRRPPGCRVGAGADTLLHRGMSAGGEQAFTQECAHPTVYDADQFTRAAAMGGLMHIHHAPSRADERVKAFAVCSVDTDPLVLIGRVGDVVLGAS